eukprot:COSAG01_NODE_1441_length_10293_cov_4.232392_14_plen_39_part_00
MSPLHAMAITTQVDGGATDNDTSSSEPAVSILVAVHFD